MTDWYAIPEVDRLAVVRDVQRRFAELCVCLPKEQQEAQRQETNRRHAKKKTKVLNAQMQAALYYRRYVTQALAKTTAELDEMVESAVTESAKDEVYRNQIRLRKYVYQIKKGMPNIGEKNKEKLKQSVVDLLVAEQTNPLPELHAQPAAMRLREAMLAPDQHAMQLDIKHRLAAVVEAQKAMMALVNEGQFQANPRTRPQTARDPPAPRQRSGGPGPGGAASGRRARARARARAARAERGYAWPKRDRGRAGHCWGALH